VRALGEEVMVGAEGDEAWTSALRLLHTMAQGRVEAVVPLLPTLLPTLEALATTRIALQVCVWCVCRKRRGGGVCGGGVRLRGCVAT
jgi:hypothetical protein